MSDRNEAVRKMVRNGKKAALLGFRKKLVDWRDFAYSDLEGRGGNDFYDSEGYYRAIAEAVDSLDNFIKREANEH